MKHTLVLLFLCFVINSTNCESDENIDTPCKCDDNKTNCFCVDQSLCDEETKTITRWGGTAKIDKIDVITCDNGLLCCHAPADAPESVETTPKCGTHVIITEDRILSNNFKEPMRGQYPWVVAISLKTESGYTFKCWGSIIHPQVILTATHNLATIEEGLVTDEIQVVSGVGDSDDLDTSELDEEQQLRLGKDVIFHSKHILVILKEPFELNNFVRTICLPPSDYPMTDGKRCQAVGWESAKETLKYVQKVTLPLVERGACQKQLRKTTLGSTFNLDASFICAGGEEKEDTCVGDGGSPLVCDYDESSGAVQVGITSWGVSCGKKDEPSAYVNVPLFVDWIKSTLKIKGIEL